MNQYPAQYHRNSKNWSSLLGKTGTVILASQLEVSAKEHELFLPYSFLIVELDDITTDPKKIKTMQNLEKKVKIEVMGEAKTVFYPGDKVQLELRKIASIDDISVIPYGIKACKI